MPWKYLGSGNFNSVYCDERRSRVFKVQKTDELEGTDLLLDMPERSVRLWNQINPDLIPKAVIMQEVVPAYLDRNADIVPGGLRVGWSLPFVEGRNSTQEEITNALIDIYNRCGRTVLDAIVRGNFKTLDNGQVVCVDIGMALQLQEKQDELGVENTSFASITTWDSTFKETYLPWFNKFCLDDTSPYKNVAEMTKALFVMQQLFPHYVNVDFLRDPQYKDLKTALANELDNPGSFMQNEAAKLVLKEINPLGKIPEVPEYKIFLERKLQDYMHYLPVEYKGKFSSPITIQIYKNKMLTEKRIDCAEALLKELLETDNKEQALDTIQKALEDPRNIELLTKGDTQLEVCLMTCGEGLMKIAEQSNAEQQSLKT